MTTPQIGQFVATYQDAARSAASQLGLPWQWVLAQWGMESGWNPAIPSNPGFITNPQGASGVQQVQTSQGPRAFPVYPDLATFVQQYVSAFKADFPGYRSAQALVNAQASGLGGGPLANFTTQFSVASVFGGAQNYDPGNAGYASSVQGALSTLQTYLGEGQSSLSNISPIGSYSTAQGAGSAVQSAATSAVSSLSSTLSSIGKGLQTAGLVAACLLIMLLGLVLLILPDAEKIAEKVA